jgi:putative glutamine amidotransferase
VLLPPGQPQPAADLLEPFDGLLLAGGGDIDPGRYGAARHPASGGNERGLPTLAICRGMQVLNVAFGGSLRQHLPDGDGLVRHRGEEGGEQAMHPVRIQAGSRLAEALGGTTAEVLSHHHQGVERAGEGLRPVAWSPDGLLEGVEREQGWTVGVLWHPEATAKADPVQQGLIGAFVGQAARFGARAMSR